KRKSRSTGEIARDAHNDRPVPAPRPGGGGTRPRPRPHRSRAGAFAARLAQPLRETRRAVHARRRHRWDRPHPRRAALRNVGPAGGIENKPGAGGNIASEFVAHSAPDGYTIYITAAGLAVNRYLFASINYDPLADFAPVMLICLFPNILVVPSSSQVHSVSDLLALAKNNPGKVTFASPGHGSSPHMSGELFKYLAKVELTHVPYRGASPAYTDVIAGRVDCTFAVMASALPLVQSGQLRALGVTTATRVAAAPEVPTIAEAGVPGYDTSSWFAFFVPAKTPPEIIRK